MTNMRYLLRQAAGRSPLMLGLFPLLNTKARQRKYAVQSATQICIEGYPRSANSFFCWYFREANPGIVVAHHLHVPANVIAAARKNLPNIVLIRSPDDAILSLMVGFNGSIAADQLAQNYIHFYRRIQADLPKCVIADFETTTRRPQSVISAVNDKFGTAFLENLPKGLIVENFKQHAIDYTAHQTGRDAALNLLPTPDDKKEKEKVFYKSSVMNSKYIEKSREIYRQLLAHPSIVR